MVCAYEDSIKKTKKTYQKNLGENRKEAQGE